MYILTMNALVLAVHNGTSCTPRTRYMTCDIMAIVAIPFADYYCVGYIQAPK
jgi:hypothetical protein